MGGNCEGGGWRATRDLGGWGSVFGFWLLAPLKKRAGGRDFPSSTSSTQNAQLTIVKCSKNKDRGIISDKSFTKTILIHTRKYGKDAVVSYL